MNYNYSLNKKNVKNKLLNETKFDSTFIFFIKKHKNILFYNPDLNGRFFNFYEHNNIIKSEKIICETYTIKNISEYLDLKYNRCFIIKSAKRVNGYYYVDGAFATYSNMHRIKMLSEWFLKN